MSGKVTEQIAGIPVLPSTYTFAGLPKVVKDWVEDKVKTCQPDNVYLCNGSAEENMEMAKTLLYQGVFKRLDAMDKCWLTLTDPKDVARVESRTFISTPKIEETAAKPTHGFIDGPADLNLRGLKCSALSNWMSPEDLEYEYGRRFPGCMKGRTMYVIPYSMGPVGGPISKNGIEVSDSAYVVASMIIMTRVSPKVMDEIAKTGDFIKCLHSVGVPLPTTRKIIHNWPCNPEMTFIAHVPARNEIISFGSGYGGNSLLGKKCFSLRLGSILAKREGWLAEHMLILGITNPQGVKKYIAAAFPSQCGKTNLAMIEPALPGWKAECVGDDIAWLKFNDKGELRAINPENGFFGVCPGTSDKTNPMALKTAQTNTIFTNVASTNDGRVFWEGLEHAFSKDEHFMNWKGQHWTMESKEPAAHPNSRFCTPAGQCPIIDPLWESPEGVPISAILFGGRRPEGVPLVYEAYDWQHGVFIGASMRSEATAAAEHKGKVIMHDPFAMRPFFSYNFGDYCKHWLSVNQPGRKMPKIFHVNWFRKSDNGKGSFLWPGFGDNMRVLEWVFKRTENVQGIAQETPIGYVPTRDALNFSGLNLKSEAVDELFKIEKSFWLTEVEQLKAYFDENVNVSTPKEIYEQIEKIKQRLAAM